MTVPDRLQACSKVLVWCFIALLLRDLAWSPVSAEDLQQGLRGMAPGYAMELLFALFLSWVFLAFEHRTLATLGLRLNRRWAGQFGLGTLAGGAIILVAAFAAALFGGVRWSPQQPGLGPLATGLGLYLLVAWVEELQFRGYPFQRLCQALGPWAAQILFAAYFIHAHWENPGMTGGTRIWASLNIGLAALLLGFAWLRTGSLAFSLGLHLGWNWTQGPLLGFGVSGTHDPSFLRPILPGARAWLHGGSFGLEAGLPCALATLAAIFLVARFSRPGAILEAPREEPCRDGS